MSAVLMVPRVRVPGRCLDCFAADITTSGYCARCNRKTRTYSAGWVYRTDEHGRAVLVSAPGEVTP